MRWRERFSKAAHWASKASSCGCRGGWEAGEDGASWDGAAQLSAPLKVTLPLEAWRGAAFTAVDCGGLMNGLMLLTAWASCGGVMEDGTGNAWGCVAEPNTLATICEGVIPTTGTLG